MRIPTLAAALCALAASAAAPAAAQYVPYPVYPAPSYPTQPYPVQPVQPVEPWHHRHHDGGYGGGYGYGATPQISPMAASQVTFSGGEVMVRVGGGGGREDWRSAGTVSVMVAPGQSVVVQIPRGDGKYGSASVQVTRTAAGVVLDGGTLLAPYGTARVSIPGQLRNVVVSVR